VALSDIDVMWLRDPTPFYQRYPDADVLTSSDELRTTVGSKEVLERYPEAGGTFNVGGCPKCCDMLLTASTMHAA
jgi:hypothetical protein